MATRWPRSAYPTEKVIQQHVMLALRTLGFRVSNLSQPRATMQTIGLPDVYAQHPGWRLRVWVEVKTPRGRVSPAQAAWHATEHAAGGQVLVVRGVADVLDGLRQLGAPIEP